MPLRVLVADDEILIRIFFQSALNRLGHNVVTASNADEAISFMKDHRFDLLLTDIRMPGDGMELIKSVRRMSHINTKIIVCSGYFTEKVSQDLKAQGIAMLPKPLRLNDLQKAIEGISPAPARPDGTI